MPHVDVDGLTINYDAQGEGEPLLLIPYTSADHACWAFQLPAYTEHFSCIAIDLNPRENPYVGCGKVRDATRRSYLDRSRIRTGMVTPAVVRAFASIGWGWGGAWTGDTRDYMHFSTTGT